MEIGAGAGVSEIAGHGQVMSGAQLTGQSSTVSRSGSSESASAAESFRSRLQSLMASLNTGTNAPGVEVAEICDDSGIPASAPATSAPAATLPSESGLPLGWRLEGGEEAGSSATATKQVSASSREQTLAVKQGADVSTQVAGDASPKCPARARSIASSCEKQAVDSSKTVKKSATAEDLAQVPAVVPTANIPLPIRLPLAATSYVHTTSVAQQLAPSEIAVTTPIFGAQGLFGQDSLKGGNLGTGERQASAALNRVMGTAGKSALAGNSLAARIDGGPAIEDRSTSSEDLSREGLTTPASQDAPIEGDETTSSGKIRSQTRDDGQPVAAGITDVASSLGSEEMVGVSAGANPTFAQSAAAPQNVGKAVLASAKRTTEQVTLRTTHTAGGAEAAEFGNYAVSVQTASQAADATTLVRDLGAAHGTLNADGGNTASTSAVSASSVRETFSALDAETGPRAPAWIHAGALRAEAGFQDPSLGWVGVRADTSGGGVHASLVPGSAEASQALGGHLAGLNAHLAAEHSPVETVTLASPEGRGAGVGADQGSQSMYQGSGQNAGQGGYTEPQSGEHVTASAITARTTSEAGPQAGAHGAAAQSARPVAGHISVMA